MRTRSACERRDPHDQGPKPRQTVRMRIRQWVPDRRLIRCWSDSATAECSAACGRAVLQDPRASEEPTMCRPVLTLSCALGWGSLSGASSWSVEAEHGHECVVDGPHFVGRQVSNSVAEASSINRTELLDEHPCGGVGNRDFWSKRRRSGAARCGSDDHDRARQELVGLHDDAVAGAMLFVANALGQSESVDLTPAHEVTPSVRRRRASRHGRTRQPRERPLRPRGRVHGEAGPPMRARTIGWPPSVSSRSIRGCAARVRPHRRVAPRSPSPCFEHDEA